MAGGTPQDSLCRIMFLCLQFLNIPDHEDI